MLLRLVFLTLIESLVTRVSSSSNCPTDMLAVYSLSLKTEWSEKTFPKQYPQWRPSAQWSKTIGYVHSVPSPLFSLGSTISDGVRQFVETGSTDKLEIETSTMTFLDAVLAPPITTGVGESNTTIFVDTNHTKISLMTKIVPSPDWFIGLDSLDLCSQGSFVDSVITEASPLDGGTDNGFTFTSPNWATEPQDSVFTITSTYPAHPAGSFNYPNLSRLPTLAVYSLTKLREYSLEQNYEKPKETNGGKESQKGSDTKYQYDIFDGLGSNQVDRKDTNDVIEFIPIEKEIEKAAEYEIVSNDIKPAAISIKSQSRSFLGSSKPSKGFRSFSSVNGYHASTSPENFFKKKYSSDHPMKAIKENKSPALSKSDLYKKIMNHYLGNKVKKTTRRKKKFRKKSHKRHHRKPRDCKVSEWSSWGPCSKTCGIGETLRTRVIEQHPAHGGRHCPPLRDYKWCGSARNCNKGYFSW